MYSLFLIVSRAVNIIIRISELDVGIESIIWAKFRSFYVNTNRDNILSRKFNLQRLLNFL